MKIAKMEVTQKYPARKNFFPCYIFALIFKAKSAGLSSELRMAHRTRICPVSVAVRVSLPLDGMLVHHTGLLPN
jgi:hypothetical protein